MRVLSLLILPSIAGLLGGINATVLPASEVVAVSRGLDLSSHDMHRNLTKFEVQVSQTDMQFSTVLGILSTVNNIALLGCSVTLRLWTPIIPAAILGAAIFCGLAAVLAVVSTALQLKFDSYNPNQGRSVQEALVNIHAEYLPTKSCNTLCRVRSAVDSENWRSIGNTTANGVFHDIHFLHNAGALGIRAIPRSTGAKKRDDTEDVNGLVAAYFWKDKNKSALVAKRPLHLWLVQYTNPE